MKSFIMLIYSGSSFLTWQRIFTEEDFNGIDIPILHITGYYDGDQPGALHYYENIVKHGPKPEQQYLIMGPWDHAGTRFPKRYLRGVDFTKESEMDMKYVHLEWFDYWLKGIKNKVKKWPLTKYFIMNENRWHETHQHWPMNPEKQTYFLHSNGKANSFYGGGELVDKPKDVSKDMLIYNPENPAMLTTSFDFYGSSEEIPLDRRYMLRRDDHLVYTSKKLKSSMTVVGSPEVELYVSSDCPDTDFFVSLMETRP